MDLQWLLEANHRMPVDVWTSMMDHYYPNSSWLRLRRDVFDRLQEFKRQNAIPTFEQAIQRLMEAAQTESVS